MQQDIVLQNKHFTLTLGADAQAKSLVLCGQQCLVGELPLCSVTQSRFYNNENKLANPNKEITLQANRLRQEGNCLVVGFEKTTYEAVLEVTVADAYIGFRLADFIVPEDAFEGLTIDTPPVKSFRILQLNVKNRKNFGQWLGVMWDEAVAVSILAANVQTLVDAEEREESRIMTATALREIQLIGTEATLVATATDDFLDTVDAVEEAYGLPHGVRARRDRESKWSYYHCGVYPHNVDEHIALCKKCGFTHMTLSHHCLFYSDGYKQCGDYDGDNFHKYYNSWDELKNVVQKIRDAGIVPGMHFLHTHIGLESKYISPRADHRLNLKRHFTLSRPLEAEDTTVYVEENPQGAPVTEGCRVLRFGGELIQYESYSAENRCFTGCVRGHLQTMAQAHPMGLIGGVLDISEFLAQSCHIDQNSGLQDEIAEKMAKVYDLGFEYIYMDGSEGVNEPFAYYVPYAQWRVWQKLGREPKCCEGAAKSHFSWHMMPCGNAFDVFPPSVFKEMIRRHPAAEAPQMKMDFTRLNFGWWRLYDDLQPDHWEYGCSMAAAWDCPVSVHFSLLKANVHPKLRDLTEVLRRWEDVRIHDLLTPEEKKTIRENPLQEHILLLNEEKQYELVPYEQIAAKDETIRAFLFTRRGKNWVVYWHVKGEGELSLIPDAEVCEELYESPVIYASGVVPASHRRYWKTDLSRQEIMNLLGE